MSASIHKPVMAVLALSALALALPLRAQTAEESSQQSGTQESSRESGTVVVLPGDDRLDVSRMVPHRATWRVTIENADGSSTVQGLWTDTWVRFEEDGRPVMAFRTLFVDPQGNVLVDNETVFDATSFRGLRATQHLPPGGTRVSYRYDGDTVSGTLQLSGGDEPRQFEVVFDEPVWEPLTPLLVLFPFEGLEPGTVIRYPIWNQATGPVDDVTWRTFRVGSIRPAQAPDGSAIEAWSWTMTTDAAPGVVFRGLRRPEPPYGWWLRVERPTLVREWTLVDWQPYAPVPEGLSPETSPRSEGSQDRTGLRRGGAHHLPWRR